MLPTKEQLEQTERLFIILDDLDREETLQEEYNNEYQKIRVKSYSDFEEIEI